MCDPAVVCRIEPSAAAKVVRREMVRSLDLLLDSLVVNLRITQIANGTVGVHALTEREVLASLRR